MIYVEEKHSYGEVDRMAASQSSRQTQEFVSRPQQNVVEAELAGFLAGFKVHVSRIRSLHRTSFLPRLIARESAFTRTSPPQLHHLDGHSATVGSSVKT